MDCPVDDDLVEGQYSSELTIEYTNECLQQLPFDPRFFTTSVAVTDLEAVRVALSKAVAAYNAAVGSLEAKVLPGARKFKELGAATSGVEIGQLEQIETTSRALQAPELVEASRSDDDATMS